MSTQNFEDKNIRYAYDSIHVFFDNYHLESAIKETDGIIKAASQYKPWKESYPYRVIYFIKLLKRLCKSAWVIHYGFSTTRAGCILETTTEKEMLKQEQFIIRGSFSTMWNNFPRHLTASQYCDPYKAIKKFAEYMAERQWKKTLKIFTEYALSDTSIAEEYPDYNLLTIRLRLLQLIEACHLLEVRSNLKKAEAKSNQKKKKSKK